MAKLYVVDSASVTHTFDNSTYTSSINDKRLRIADSAGSVQQFPLANTTMTKVDIVTLATNKLRVCSDTKTYCIATSNSKSTNSTSSFLSVYSKSATVTIKSQSKSHHTTKNITAAVSGRWSHGGIYITVSGAGVYMGCNDVYHKTSTQWNYWGVGVHNNIRNYGIGNFYSTIYFGPNSTYNLTGTQGYSHYFDSGTNSMKTVSTFNRNRTQSYSVNKSFQSSTTYDFIKTVTTQVEAGRALGTNVAYVSNYVKTTSMAGAGASASLSTKTYDCVSSTIASVTVSANNIATV